MKKFVFAIILTAILTGGATAETHFSKKADQRTPQNSGRIYEIGSRGFVVIEGKRGGKIGERLSPRVVALPRKALTTKESELKSTMHPATSHVMEFDLFKFEF